MPDTAPALTDEQIGSSPADDPQIDDDVRALVEGESMPEETAWAIIAAVVARAKREAAEEIAQAIEREAATLDHLPPTDDPGVTDYRMGLRHGMAGSVEHDLIGAAGIARQIGATR